MSDVINLTHVLVNQKIIEISKDPYHPYHSALSNLDLRQKVVVCVLNQLKPNYVFFDGDNASITEISQSFSEDEQNQIERLINNSIIPVLQEADTLKHFPHQSHSISTEETSHWFG